MKLSDYIKDYNKIIKCINIYPYTLENIEFSNKRIKDIVKFYNENEIEQNTIQWDILMFMFLDAIKNKASKKVLNKFLDFWRKTTHPRKKIRNFIYNPPNDYLQILHEPRILSRILEIYNIYKMKPNFEEEFLKSFHNIVKSIRIKFTDNEFNILKCALELNTINAKQIASKINKNYTYVDRIIKKLVNENILIVRPRFSFASLKLMRIFAVIEYFKRENIKYIRSPWVYSQSITKYGTPINTVHFLVPESWKVPDICRRIKSNLNKDNNVRNVEIYKVLPEVFKRPRNFEFFDYKSGKWISDKSKIMIEIEKRWDSGKHVEYKIIERNKHPYLTKTELKILKAYWDYGNLPLKKLREKVGIDYNKLRTLVKELKKKILVNQITISGRLIPHNLTIISNLSREEHARLLYALNILPEVYSYRYINGINNNEEISLIHLRLVEEQIDAVTDAVTKILKTKIKWILPTYTISEINWTIPIDRWLEAYQEFKIDDDDFKFSNPN